MGSTASPDAQCRPGINDAQCGKHQRQHKVPGFEPPGRQVILHIEDGLESDANSPEHSHVRAETARQGTSTGKLARVEDAQRRKCDDRQHDVAPIHPIHLSMEARKALQFSAPVQTERNESGGDQNGELPNARYENQASKHRLHQIAPNARMNGTMTSTTKGRWNSKPTGAT